VAYAKNFDLVVDTGQLILLKHPNKHHYFIQIVPALETWIIAQANEVGIDMATHGLPDNLNDLKYQSKTLKSKKDPRFKRLFKALMKEKATGIELLTEWVMYLKQNPYDADLTFFKAR
jgi:hypothetical protein